MEKEKNNSEKRIIIFTVCIVVILVVLGLSVWYVKSGKTSFLTNKTKQKVSLKYTTTSKTKSEGVYIMTYLKW